MKRNGLVFLFALLMLWPVLAVTRQPQYFNPALSILLATDKSIYRSGETIKMTLVAKNDTPRTFKTVFSSAKRFDFAVYDPANKAVWRWSADRMFAQAITPLVLKPGEKAVFTANWNQQDGAGVQVAAGDYRLKGAILCQAGVNNAARRITITR